MKTWICTTLANFYGPLLGAARLYAYTKKQGHDVHFKDFNQDAYFSLLSRGYLEPTLQRIEYTIDSISRNRFLRADLGALVLQSSNNALRQLIAKGILLNMPWYSLVSKTNIAKKPILGLVNSKIRDDNVVYALLSEKEYVLSEIERSRQIINDGFYSLNPDDFLAHFHNLLCGKSLIDVAYFPSQLDFGLGFYGMSYRPQVSDILRAVEDDRHNFLIPYYRNEVLPLLCQEHPALVGISITCMFELIPAFTLAHMIKKVDPKIHVVLGGVLVTELYERIGKNRPLWDLFDSLILGPGEYAFCELIEQLSTKGDLSSVSNVIYRDKDSIRKSNKTREFDINDACTPEFVSVRPKSGLPLETSSSCYWGKCIFCYYPKQGTADLDAKHQTRRVRRIELVLEDIRTLKERYDPLFIGITDSSMHPRRIEAIAEDNLRSKRGIKFSSLFRLEKQFKSKAFCYKLAEGGFLGGYVGLESGAQRINDIINKGVDLKDAEVIIKNFFETGILLHVYSIIGTPGETEEDAIMTYRFFKRWHRWLRLDWQIYPLYVLEQAPLALRAREFDLQVTSLPDDYLVESTLYSTANGLSQEQSMALSIKYSEKLKRYMHPLHQIMDVESLKLFLMMQMAKGIPPHKVRNRGIRI